MKKILLQTAPRLILGALFLISAIDGFWFLATGAHLIHPPTSERGMQFEQALIASGFFWPFLKVVNLAGALSLLTNRAPAFGLALIAPVVAVIVLFHIFLNPQGIPVAVLLVVCGALLGARLCGYLCRIVPQSRREGQCCRGHRPGGGRVRENRNASCTCPAPPGIFLPDAQLAAGSPFFGWLPVRR